MSGRVKAILFLIVLGNVVGLCCLGAWAWRRATAAPLPPPALPEPERIDWGGIRLRGMEVGSREVSAMRLDTEQERGPIRCLLRKLPRSGRRSEAELVLSNVGQEPVRFEHTTMGMMEHVTMFLRDGDGKVVSSLYFATLSSHAPSHLKPPREVRLRAGEEDIELVHPSSLIRPNDGLRPKPGRYTFQAAFMHGDECFARSERIPVEVTANEVIVLDP